MPNIPIVLLFLLVYYALPLAMLYPVDALSVPMLTMGKENYGKEAQCGNNTAEKEEDHPQGRCKGYHTITEVYPRTMGLKSKTLFLVTATYNTIPMMVMRVPLLHMVLIRHGNTKLRLCSPQSCAATTLVPSRDMVEPLPPEI
jgi:hypothetical protein